MTIRSELKALAGNGEEDKNKILAKAKIILAKIKARKSTHKEKNKVDSDGGDGGDDSLPSTGGKTRNKRVNYKTSKRTKVCTFKKPMKRSLQELQEYCGKSDNMKLLGKGVFEPTTKRKRTRQDAPTSHQDNRHLMSKGTRVAIYWFEDNVWYPGTVKDTNFNHESLVKFDDGTQDWFNMCMEGPRVRAI
tara:strand:+ start:439 stop:1008 length:570 start_codon:yes stop_codon:yes gene_type:complete